MAKENEFVFRGLHVVAWVIFVGLCIEAGGIIVNFLFTILKPAYIDRLYQKLNLLALYEENKWVFFGIYSFIIFIAVLKAMLFYEVIKLMNVLDMQRPFQFKTAKQILEISYMSFSIGIIGYIARQVSKNVLRRDYDLDTISNFWVDSQAFILMAAVVYIIGQIFKKGVELQHENDLTI